MEVSPDVYAWLTSLNIIDPFSEINENGSNTYTISENKVEALFEGHYFDIMILNLQEAYNKYYNNRKNCEPKLKELVFKEKNYPKISSKTRIYNWNVINDALDFFNLKFSKNDLNKILNKNTDALLKIIMKIFNTITKLLKYTKKEYNNIVENKTNKENRNYLPNINWKKNNDDNINKKLNNNSKNNKSFEEENSILTSNKKELTKKRNNKNSKNNDFKPNSLNEENLKDINENNNSEINNNSIQDILSSKKPLTEYVDITKLSAHTAYEKCETTLEFFIISLCKNFNINPAQSIGLLSNNRQYLSVLCKSGINGNYLTIKKWLEDLQINFDIILKLIMKYEDGTYMSYCIIGTALCSKNLDVSIYSIDLLSKLYEKVGLNVPWFTKIGINSFIFAFIKHNTKILYFLEAMCNFIKSNEAIFFQEIKNKINTDTEYKTLILDLFPTIIPYSKEIKNDNFKSLFQKFLLEICLHEEYQLTYSCSILCEIFFYYHENINDDIENKIILFFKKCIRSFSSNTYGAAIAKIFVLVTKISKSYNQYAPGILKCLVALLIEMYDDIIRREIFLENFENFFNEQKQVPLDIFFDPYINKIKSCNNYNICDFTFLWKIIEHPRLEYKDYINIINFLINVSLKNDVFNRCSLFVMEKILNDFYPKLANEEQIDNLSQIFISYINKVIETCMINNEDNINNEAFLEMSFILTQYDIGKVNNTVKNQIIEYTKYYYNKYRIHSSICLEILKKYEDFSDIIMKIENNDNSDN